MLILTIYNIMALEQTRSILRSDLFLGPLITDFQIKKKRIIRHSTYNIEAARIRF